MADCDTLVKQQVGIHMGMGFPRKSHRNGNSFWATNGNGNGNNVMRMVMAHVKSPVLHSNIQ